MEVSHACQFIRTLWQVVQLFICQMSLILQVHALCKEKSKDHSCACSWIRGMVKADLLRLWCKLLLGNSLFLMMGFFPIIPNAMAGAGCVFPFLSKAD